MNIRLIIFIVGLVGFVLLLVLLPYILFFIQFATYNSTPFYNEAVYIGLSFKYETNFTILVPAIIQNNGSQYNIVESIKGLIKENNKQDKYRVDLIKKNISIDNNTISVHFISLEGRARQIDLFKEYSFQPETRIDYESDLFSTTLSGLLLKSTGLVSTKSAFYYSFGNNNQTWGLIRYFFSASTNWCIFNSENYAKLSEETDINTTISGSYLINQTYTGAGWVNISLHTGAACA